MGPVQCFNPDRLYAKQFDVHGAENIGLEVLADRHDGNVVISDPCFFEGCFILAIRYDRFGQCIRQPRHMPLIGIDPEHRVAKPSEFAGNCAAKGSKADHGKASGFQRSSLPAVAVARM